MSARLRWTVLLVAAALFVSRPVLALQGRTGGGLLARSDLFTPLLADPHEPGFFATYLFARSPHLARRIGSVGLGQTMGLVRSPTGRWQLAVAAGVFSQFDMASTTNHLMNTDYIVGFPVSYRRGTWSARLRLYHQSSHLGEEFIDGGPVTRQLLSFEAVEVLIAEEFSGWRAYAGGEYRYQHRPTDIQPTLLHAGLEYLRPDPLLRLGRFGDGRLVAALDSKSFEDRGWHVAWSVRAGLAFDRLGGGDDAGWRWAVLLSAHDGPAPYGQFFREHLSSVGLGIAFSL